MKHPKVFSKIGRQYSAWRKARREVQVLSNEALNRSKRSIFAFHRDDVDGAESLLQEAEALFAQCDKKLKKMPHLADEGTYKAALEEYAEAQLYAQYRKSGSFGEVKRALDASIYLGGLCDATGEVVRFAVRRATQGDIEAVRHAYATVEAVVDFLLQLDLTGHLRNKFDQTKRNLRSLEQMLYELSLRQ